LKQEIIADRDNSREVVEKIHLDWIKYILEASGINIDDCFPKEDNTPITLNQKVKFREVLKQNSVIIDSFGGETSIYIQENLIAVWQKPIYSVHIDRSKIDPNKRIYNKIVLDYSSVFDEEFQKD
jgi:hypothetical protein